MSEKSGKRTLSTSASAQMLTSIVYVISDCPYSSRMLEEMRAAGEQPVVIDVAQQRQTVPELLKITGGRRIVPVRVRGTDIAVAPEGGTEF